MKNTQTVTSNSSSTAGRGAGGSSSANASARKDIGATKEAAPKKQTKNNKLSASHDLQQMIREEAYFRSERRGFVGGSELQDWFEAEQEVHRMLSLDLPRH